MVEGAKNDVVDDLHLRKNKSIKVIFVYCQMGARQERSTETAVASLLARVRSAWDSDGAVASVLALDLSGAFGETYLGHSSAGPSLGCMQLGALFYVRSADYSSI